MKKRSPVDLSWQQNIVRGCVCLLAFISLAVGAFSVLPPEAAEAICQIDALGPVYECQPFTYIVTVHSYVGSYQGNDVYTCAITSFSGFQKPALPAGIYVMGSTISGCAPYGSRGTYRLGFMCQEYKNGQYYPAGGPHSYEKYVDVTIMPGAPGCTCTGTGGNYGGGGGGGTGGGYYPPPTPTTYKFTVSIGSGLSAGKTDVMIDGKKQAELGGGESKDFQTDTGSSPVVSVKSPITGQQGSRYTVKGDTEKKVSEGDTSAYFDYAPAIYIQFVTDPSNLTALPGSDWYSVGDKAQSSAPATVDGSDPGTRYTFSGWMLPNGQKSQMKSISITASAPATVTASYTVNYKLTISSPYGQDETTWQKAGEEVNFQAKNLRVPMTGLMGFLGGEMTAVNTGGKIVMDGPKSVTVQYQPSYPWLAFLIIALLVIGGGLFAFYRVRSAKAGATPSTPAPTIARTKTPAAEAATEVKLETPLRSVKEEKEAAVPTKAKAAAEVEKAGTKPRFCPECGDPVKAEEKFCDKCGTKLEVDQRPLNCPKCGDPVGEEEKFCDKCGEKLK